MKRGESKRAESKRAREERGKKEKLKTENGKWRAERNLKIIFCPKSKVICPNYFLK